VNGLEWQQQPVRLGDTLVVSNPEVKQLADVDERHPASFLLAS
jgi:phosphotransacetylase